MDYHELNAHVDAFRANADVCANKLREWRQLGSNVCLLDLRKAYLQVRVSETMWPFQTVVIASRRYCLTRLGFGLNVAPQIMKTIVNAVLSQQERIKEGTSAYLDDIYVNEDVVSSSRVRSGCLWPFLSSSWVAFGRPSYLWAVLPGVPRHWRFPPASGGLGLLPGAWGAPKRGMPTGPKVFLALPDACGLRPCDRAHLKNGLVPYSCVGGTQR